MKFLKVEWTKKRGSLALLATCLAITSFVLGGYVATGNLNPWGNKHYYQVLNANFQECHSLSGSTTCTTQHNVVFNTGAKWVEQTATQFNPTGCVPSATCGMDNVAMTGSSVTFAAGDASTGASQGNCGASGAEGGSELTTNGFAAAKATTITDISGGTGAAETLQITFTDATASTTVAGSCIANQLGASSANRVLLAGASFTAITLQIGDTIQITWTLTWSWT